LVADLILIVCENFVDAVIIVMSTVDRTQSICVLFFLPVI